jgi:hypothetical protein
MRSVRMTAGFLFAATIAAGLPAIHAARFTQSVESPKFNVILLGTGGGPRVDVARFGISTLVEAGQTRLLFDCGRASTIRMAQLGIRSTPSAGCFSHTYTPTTSLDFQTCF